MDTRATAQVLAVCTHVKEHCLYVSTEDGDKTIYREDLVGDRKNADLKQFSWPGQYLIATASDNGKKRALTALPGAVNPPLREGCEGYAVMGILKNAEDWGFIVDVASPVRAVLRVDDVETCGLRVGMNVMCTVTGFNRKSKIAELAISSGPRRPEKTEDVATTDLAVLTPGTLICGDMVGTQPNGTVIVKYTDELSATVPLTHLNRELLLSASDTVGAQPTVASLTKCLQTMVKAKSVFRVISITSDSSSSVFTSETETATDKKVTSGIVLSSLDHIVNLAPPPASTIKGGVTRIVKAVSNKAKPDGPVRVYRPLSVHPPLPLVWGYKGEDTRGERDDVLIHCTTSNSGKTVSSESSAASLCLSVFHPFSATIKCRLASGQDMPSAPTGDTPAPTVVHPNFPAEVLANDIVKGTIKTCSEKGVVLEVGKIHVLVPPEHAADSAPSGHSERAIRLRKQILDRLKPGQEVTCRVITVDAPRQRIISSLKPGLLSLPLLESRKPYTVGSSWIERGVSKGTDKSNAFVARMINGSRIPLSSTVRESRTSLALTLPPLGTPMTVTVCPSKRPCVAPMVQKEELGKLLEDAGLAKAACAGLVLKISDHDRSLWSTLLSCFPVVPTNVREQVRAVPRSMLTVHNASVRAGMTGTVTGVHKVVPGGMEVLCSLQSKEGPVKCKAFLPLGLMAETLSASLVSAVELIRAFGANAPIAPLECVVLSNTDRSNVIVSTNPTFTQMSEDDAFTPFRDIHKVHAGDAVLGYVHSVSPARGYLVRSLDRAVAFLSPAEAASIPTDNLLDTSVSSALYVGASVRAFVQAIIEDGQNNKRRVDLTLKEPAATQARKLSKQRKSESRRKSMAKRARVERYPNVSVPLPFIPGSNGECVVPAPRYFAQLPPAGTQHQVRLGSLWFRVILGYDDNDRPIVGKVHAFDVNNDADLVDHPFSAFVPGQRLSYSLVKAATASEPLPTVSLSLAGEGMAEEEPIGVQSVSDLLAGRKYKGYVASVNVGGVYVSLGRNTTVLVTLSEVDDSFVSLDNVKDLYTPGTVVDVVITRKDKKGTRAWATLKPSITSCDTIMSMEEVCELVGSTVSGKVKAVSKPGVFVTINGTYPPVVGLARASDATDLHEASVAQLSKIYSVGTDVLCAVLKADANKKRVSLGLRAGHILAAGGDAGELASRYTAQMGKEGEEEQDERERDLQLMMEESDDEEEEAAGAAEEEDSESEADDALFGLDLMGAKKGKKDKKTMAKAKAVKRSAEAVAFEEKERAAMAAPVKRRPTD
ncbi:hypothetical protein KIPB_005761, partial [Kipferlia bialata]|eukprot:g5761.t1